MRATKGAVRARGHPHYRVVTLRAAPRNPQIIRSESDPNVYRHIKLNNGMQVMLVSDTTGTSKGAASMDVHAGQFQDPVRSSAARAGARRRSHP